MPTNHTNNSYSILSKKPTIASPRSKTRTIWQNLTADTNFHHSMRVAAIAKTSALHYIFLLLFFLTTLNFTSGFCPAKCQCQSGDSYIRANCSNAGFEDVPIQLNPDTTVINLKMNRIRNIEYALPFYVHLMGLDLSENIIETLGSKNFEYQNELAYLNLSHNLVSSLRKDAFKGLTSLKFLGLSYNRIEVVHPTAMLDLTALMTLDLTNNNIVSLEDNSFAGMRSLEVLFFKNNQLLDVPAQNLQQLYSLKSLDLSQNLLENVRNASFENLKELEDLNLRGNVISDMELSSMQGLTNLQFFDMADNNLTMVPTLQLSKLSNLTYLTLNGNRFRHIPAVAFMNLFHLKELHLDFLEHLNNIDARAFIDNTHLESLHLSNNPQLSDIPLRLFQGNPNLVDIYMKSNNLQTLHAAQFPVDQLKTLFLGENPLQCNCSLLWLWRLVVESAKEKQRQVASSTVATVTDEVAQKQISQFGLDTESIVCDVKFDTKRIRRQLLSLKENEITCPAHIVTVVCAVLSCFLVLVTGASFIFYTRYMKRRQKLMQERSMHAIMNMHDRILQQQPLSGAGITAIHPHFTLQPQAMQHGGLYPHFQHDFQHSMPRMMDKLEMERYLPPTQAVANEYRALNPWELTPVKDASYSDEPEHLYEKFDYYEYPDVQTMTKAKQASTAANNDEGKPSVAYV